MDSTPLFAVGEPVYVKASQTSDKVPPEISKQLLSGTLEATIIDYEGEKILRTTNRIDHVYRIDIFPDVSFGQTALRKRPRKSDFSFNELLKEINDLPVEHIHLNDRIKLNEVTGA